MRITTALKKRDLLKSRVIDVFRLARSQKITHKQLVARLKSRIFDSPEWSRVPAWVKFYVKGYIDSEFDSMYRDALVWCHQFEGVTFISTDFPSDKLRFLKSEDSFFAYREDISKRY